MGARFWPFFAAFLASSTAFGERIQADRICPALTIRGELEPSLNDVEKRLACGDPETAPGDAWHRIPPAEARFHLRTFLQQRGYLHPEFIELPDGNILDPGEPTRVTGLVAENAPPELHLERKRKVVGQKLTPALLNELEQWATQRLQAESFPCPSVKALGDSETGKVTLEVQSGEKRPLADVIESGIPGLENGILRRYYAFRPAWPYDGDALTLTENRVVSRGFLQSLHFAPLCPKKGEEIPAAGVFVRQDAVAGPPRLFSVGFGINTEGLLLGRVRWQNNRIGNRGSDLQFNVTASSKEQQFQLLSHWYFLREPTRFHLRPSLITLRRDELYFETLTLNVAATPASSLDMRKWGATFAYGPVFDFIRTVRGPGIGDSHFASLMAEIALTTHDFEFNATRPKTGMGGGIQAAISGKDILSTASAQRLNLHWEGLWNYRDYDPPLLILGVRSGFSTTFSPERAVPGTLLPPNFLYYLGGSADLRGFGRLELPGPNGAMTSFFSGTEARLANTLPAGFEPFIFFDFGLMGAEPLSLDPPIYGSPGIGVRWASPVGAFRATLAHGTPISEGVPAHWQFYLSYGEEF